MLTVDVPGPLSLREEAFASETFCTVPRIAANCASSPSHLLPHVKGQRHRATPRMFCVGQRRLLDSQVPEPEHLHIILWARSIREELPSELISPSSAARATPSWAIRLIRQRRCPLSGRCAYSQLLNLRCRAWAVPGDF